MNQPYLGGNSDYQFILPRSSDTEQSQGAVGDWLKGSGHWWGNSGSSGGGGNQPASNPVARVNGSTMGLLPGAPYVTSRQAPGVNEFIFYQIKGTSYGRFDLIIRELSGGDNLQFAEIGPGSVPTLISSGTLDVMHSRTVCLPPLVTTDSTSANLASTWKGALHTVYLKNEFFAPIIGAGSTANKSLFKFDQVANTGTWEEGFTITPQTYSPPTHIVSLSKIYIGSVQRPRICIGFADDPARVISEIDGTPTADGTMHANTEPCFGAFDTGLNSTTPGASNTLLYANNGWWIISSTSAITAAPTQTLSGINNGGFIVGDVELQGSSLRLFYVEPIQDLGKTHMMDTNAATSGAPTAVGRVRSVNFEAEDLQDLDVGLDFVIDCKKWKGGLVQTDGQEITWHNGQIVNLAFNREGSWSADAVVSISGLAVTPDQRLFAMVVERTASTSYLYFFEYILEENVWYPVFEKITLTSGRFPVFVRETPVLKYMDRATGAAVHRFFYGVGLTSGDGITQWRSVPLWPQSLNPYYSQTTGNMPRPFATTGWVKTPIYHFFNGMKKYITDFHSQARLYGTAATMQLEVGLQDKTGMRFNGDTMDAGTAAKTLSATFSSAEWWADHHAYFADTPAIVDMLQIKLTGNQGSDSTRKTSNFVPFSIGGYVSFDGKVPNPKELEEWRFKNG